MMLIELTMDKVALVDDRDYVWLSQNKWHASFGSRNTKWYARRVVTVAEKEWLHQGRHISMHRLIWMIHNGPIPEDLVVDHIDDDSLNNQLSNLQLLTGEQNMAKSAGWKNKKSPLSTVDF